MPRMSRLSNDDWLTLAEIARHAITAAVRDKSIADLPPIPASLTEHNGVFVSLYRGGHLRGCVGQVENSGTLADLVARVAISAAMFDSRFPPISPGEISELKIEISILSELKRMQPEDIVGGRHGILVVRGSNRGLLLPQVATERNWSAQRLLEETCIKAGLPRDAWREAETQIFGFTAEIYSEKELREVRGE
jgi:AmmeMemoRadiSam system protein A